MQKLSIIIPCYNEAKNIEPLLSQLYAVESTKYRYQYIFVDDGSSDNTWPILSKLKGTKKREFTKIKFLSNYGHQSALLAGYAHAKGDIHITMDADLQHPPKYLPIFLKAYEAGHKLVLGQRRDAKLGYVKKITSKLYYKIYNLLVPNKISANAADFRLTTHTVTRQILAYSEQNTTFRAIIGHIGIKPAIVRYSQPKRIHGTSSYTPKKMFEMAKNSILQNTTFVIQAIFLFGILLTTFSTIGFIITLYFRYILKSALFSTVPLFGFFTLANNGIIFLVLGIIGLYLANTQQQTLNRPKYHIEEIKE